MNIVELDFVLLLTSSISKVKQGVCFFVSLIFTDFAFCADFSDLTKFSGITSKKISLASADTPSMAYSLKKWS